MSETERSANLLAALGLLMADEQLRAIEESTGLQPSSAAALVTIGHAPEQPIDFLRRVLRRSHSAVVRLVASLVDLGLVTKRGGSDGRAVSLALTTHGSSVVQRALDGRGRIMERHLAGLSDRERRSLTRVAEKLLAGAVADELDAYRVCRLCDADACADPCPAEAAVTGARPHG